jgi:hypothetical protein
MAGMIFLILYSTDLSDLNITLPDPAIEDKVDVSNLVILIIITQIRLSDYRQYNFTI